MVLFYRLQKVVSFFNTWMARTFMFTRLRQMHFYTDVKCPLEIRLCLQISNTTFVCFQFPVS